MGAIVLALTWACAIGITTTASRMTWSFARDKGTPFSRTLAKVSPRNDVPIVAVCVVAGLASLLHLIYVGSYVAFNDVVSLTITGFYSSYFIPASMLLYRRIKGEIAPHHSTISDGEAGPSTTLADDIKAGTASAASDAPPAYTRQSRAVSVAETPLQFGPFHIPGIFGIVNNAYACVYMIFVIFWSVWPPATPVTAESMNYSVVVTGGVIIFSIIWYFIRGRKEYHGPLIDEEVERIMQRRGSVRSVDLDGERGAI